MPKLQGSDYVHVTGDGGLTVVLAPGDDVPEWAAERIGDKRLLEGYDESEQLPAPGTGQSTAPLDLGSAKVPELRAYLDEAQVEYGSRDRREDLVSKVKAHQEQVRAGSETGRQVSDEQNAGGTDNGG